ncbi:MAG: hypothetical protein QOD86_1077, partial [Miltoncostaeaceae bacterium]|nr:hypothetical protein [Miltoncostaeaceae bacterium]
MDWPLVGRIEELELIAGTLDEPEAPGIVLAGEAGVGKTRLAATALSRAAAREWATARTTATRAAASVPFGAFAHLLPSSPEVALDRLEVLRRAGAALTAGAEGRRLLLLVDDAHLLDDGSAALVLQLAVTRTACVMVTIRSGERAPDPVTALWKDEGARLLEVQPLGRADVGRLLELALRGQVEGATIDRLAGTSEGNPLFLRELVRSGMASGSLDAPSEVWRWRGPLAPDGGLVWLIEERLQRLSAHERRLLETLALGEPMDADLLGDLAVPEALDGLEAAGLVAVHREGRRANARLAHPLYGEVLRATVRPIAARAAHRRLADALTARGLERSDDVLRVATWRLEAGQAVAPELLGLAAQHALDLSDHLLAARLAEEWIAAGGGLRARLAAGAALAGQRLSEEAEEVLGPLAASAADDEEIALVALARAANLMMGLGRPERSAEVLRKAGEAIAGELWRDRVASFRACLLIFIAPCDEVVQAASEPLARSGNDPRVAAECLLAASHASALAGRLERALELADHGVLAARRCRGGPPELEDHLLLARGWALLLSGRLRDASALAEARRTAAIAGRQVEIALLWTWFGALVALLEGRPATAARQLRDCAVAMRERDRWGVLHVALAVQAQAAAIAGDLPAAEAAAAEAVGGRAPFMRVDALWHELGQAWVADARGETAAARRHCRQAADECRALGQLAFEGLALHHLARLGDAAAAVPRLAELAGLADGPLLPALARHAAALAGHDAPGLEGAAGELEELGLVIDAAEAMGPAAAAHGANGRGGPARRAAAQ